MAVAQETSFGSGAILFDGTADTENLTVDAGTGANRVLLACCYWRDSDNRTVTMTYNGVAMTSVGAKATQDSSSLQVFRLASPASGSNTLAVSISDSGGGGASQALVGAWAGNGCDVSGTPVDGFNSAVGSGSTANIVSAVVISGDAGDRIVVFHGTRNGSDILTATPTGYTERQDVNNAAGLSLELGDADGSAALNTQATWSNGAFQVDWVAVGVNVNQSGGAGETITVDKWLNTMPAQHKRVIGMVSSGMHPPNRFGS